MATRELEVTVRHRGETAILDLSGDVESSAEATLQRAYDEAAAGGGPVVLNFAAAEYINSTGIALIVGLLARARASKRRLLAYGLSDHYVEIFEITRISDFMSVFPDEESALS